MLFLILDTLQAVAEVEQAPEVLAQEAQAVEQVVLVLVLIIMRKAVQVEFLTRLVLAVVTHLKPVAAQEAAQAAVVVVPIMKAVVKIVAQPAVAVEVEYFQVLVVQAAAVKLVKTVVLVDQEITQAVLQ